MEDSVDVAMLKAEVARLTNLDFFRQRAFHNVLTSIESSLQSLVDAGNTDIGDLLNTVRGQKALGLVGMSDFQVGVIPAGSNPAIQQTAPPNAVTAAYVKVNVSGVSITPPQSPTSVVVLATPEGTADAGTTNTVETQKTESSTSPPPV